MEFDWVIGEEGLYHICSAPSHLDICSTPGIVVDNGHKGWKPPRVRLYIALQDISLSLPLIFSPLFSSQNLEICQIRLEK